MNDFIMSLNSLSVWDLMVSESPDNRYKLIKIIPDIERMAFDFQMDQIMNKYIIDDFNGSKHLLESKVHREIVVDPK